MVPAKRRQRKPIVTITPSVLETIEKLAGYGLTTEQIADYLGVSRPTFYRYQAKDPRINETIERGKAKAATMITGRAYQMAADGKHESMTKFWLQTRLRWRTEERVVHEGAIDTSGHVSTLTAEQREKRIKELLSDPALAEKYGRTGSTEESEE